MPNNSGYNPEWWKEAKAASLARREAAPRGKLANPGDSFLIVTEGAVTEPEYFRQLLQKLRRRAVQVEIISSDSSDPFNIIKCATRLRQEHAAKARRNELPPHIPRTFDHVWAVIDTDVLTKKQLWPEALGLATKAKIKLAHSTPCFEFWLLLHLLYTTRTDLTDCSKAKAAVATQLHPIPYSTKIKTAQRAIHEIIKKWENAISHAQQVREHHTRSGTPSPSNPSTDVDQLIRAIIDAAPTHLHKRLWL